MTAPTLTPPTARTEHATFARAVRHLLAAGWFIHYDYRTIGLPNGKGGWAATIHWMLPEPGSVGWDPVMWITTADSRGHLTETRIDVRTVQQAIDVAAALLDTGHHLTTGALRAWSIADRDLDALRAQAVAA